MSTCVLIVSAQELFVYTEPASNMAAKSIGVRLNNNFMKDAQTKRVDHYFNPEVMFGFSKYLMVHAEGYFSNANGDYQLNGGGLYAKYRFYSTDAVHSHFRMAAYGRYSYIRNIAAEAPINLLLRNSGYEAGVVATSLKNKLALSASASYLHALDNSNANKWNNINDRNAFAYTLSAGQLVLPKEYISYDQLNMNLMLEALGQTDLTNGKSFLDLAPSVQFIIKSRMRVDFGYRFQVVNSYDRKYKSSALFRFEYNLFNAF